MSYVRRLCCFACERELPTDELIGLCTCGKPLRVDYDLEAIGRTLDRDALRSRPPGMWRFRELLPVDARHTPITLGEGDTPLLSAPGLARDLGVGRLLIKDEALNPTGSFKARGMAVAVSMAKILGATKLATPSAGNAGGALAAYAAAAGLQAYIFLPKDVPAPNRLECSLAGAHVTLVDGLIDACGKALAKLKDERGWFDVSTLKEPYRIEGKKIMAYEIAEQLDWVVPDVVIYPTGGGTGLIGMAKAFDEMESLGWIGPARPRFVSVQSTGCQPIVRAFESGDTFCQRWEDAHTIAAGLRVPAAIGDFVILDALRASDGTAVAVEDEDMIRDARVLSAATGICTGPEGGACLSALRVLKRKRWISPTETVVIFNTGNGLKSPEAFCSVTPRG